jgi:hypothetical protein
MTDQFYIRVTQKERRQNGFPPLWLGFDGKPPKLWVVPRKGMAKAFSAAEARSTIAQMSRLEPDFKFYTEPVERKLPQTGPYTPKKQQKTEGEFIPDEGPLQHPNEGALEF